MRGMSYSIEAVIAVFIIATAALPLLSTTAGSVDFTKEQAYQSLQYLSMNVEFREFVYENNFQELGGMLGAQFEDYEFEICSPECGGPDRYSRQTLIADWQFAGYRTSNEPRTLRVYLFR